MAAKDLKGQPIPAWEGVISPFLRWSKDDTVVRDLHPLMWILGLQAGLPGMVPSFFHLNSVYFFRFWILSGKTRRFTYFDSKIYSMH